MLKRWMQKKQRLLCKSSPSSDLANEAAWCWVEAIFCVQQPLETSTAGLCPRRIPATNNLWSPTWSNNSMWFLEPNHMRWMERSEAFQSAREQGAQYGCLSLLGGAVSNDTVSAWLRPGWSILRAILDLLPVLSGNKELLLDFLIHLA